MRTDQAIGGLGSARADVEGGCPHHDQTEFLERLFPPVVFRVLTQLAVVGAVVLTDQAAVGQEQVRHAGDPPIRSGDDRVALRPGQGGVADPYHSEAGLAD